jgi:methylated-DNA-[protein]-cysteine S-methyltransferase
VSPFSKIVEPTPFGPVAVIWSGLDGIPAVLRIFLSKPGTSAPDLASRVYPDSRPSSCAEIDAVSAKILAFLAGENVTFPLGLVALTICPPFQQAVLSAEHGIPRGSVSTYGLIARHLGRPLGARAVGNALAGNPFPLIVPCHRAVRSGGGLGGFQGGPGMKRALLEREGIAIDDAGRVAVPRYHYS